MAQMLGGGQSGQGGGLGDMMESLPMGAGGGMGLFSSPKQEQPQPQPQGFDQNQLMQQLMKLASQYKSDNRWIR
jgi:hypothetical protein